VEGRGRGNFFLNFFVDFDMKRFFVCFASHHINDLLIREKGYSNSVTVR